MDTPVPTNPPPLPVLNSNEKLWVVLCHLSSLLGVGLVLPLIVYLVTRNDSRYIADNSREALNFHISLLIYSACCVPLVFLFIGIPLLVVIGIGSLVLGILAAIKAAEGGSYRYPLTLRLVS